VATGAAVDAGLICHSGDTIDLFGQMARWRPPVALPGVNFVRVLKAFVCADESGSFLLRLEVRIDERGDNFNWVVVDGIGDYAGLHGAGQGYGIFFPGGVNDILDGTIHF
jgi:hypothetical protein